MNAVTHLSTENNALRKAVEFKQREVEQLQQKLLHVFQLAVLKDAQESQACLKVAQLARLLQHRDKYIKELESTVYAADLLCEMSQESR